MTALATWVLILSFGTLPVLAARAYLAECRTRPITPLRDRQIAALVARQHVRPDIPGGVPVAAHTAGTQHRTNQRTAE